MAGNIVIRILGDSTGLGRALRIAQRNVSTFQSSLSQLSTAASGTATAIAAIGAAGVGAGAVAGGALLGMTAAIGGGLAYMAYQNEAVSQSFKTLKENVSLAGQEFTTSLHQPMIMFAGQLETAFRAMGPSIQRLSDSFGPLLNTIGAKLVPIAAQFGLTLETAFNAGIGPMNAFIDGLSPLMTGLNGMFQALDRPEVTEFVKTLMETLGAMLPVLGELLASLTPVGTELLKALLPAFQDITGFIRDSVIPIMQEVSTFLQEHPGFITGLAAAWAILKVALIATNVVMAATNLGLTGLMLLRIPVLAMTYAWAAAQWVLNTAFLGFPLVWILVAIAAVIVAVWAIVKNWETIKQWLVNYWNEIKSEFSTAWNAIKNFFINTWNEIKSEVSTAWNFIVNTISNGLNRAKQFVVDKFNQIVGFILSLPGRFFSAGADLIRGLINGVGSMAGALVSKAREVASGALNAIKSFFGISSPSRVMKQMGVWVGEGFVIGLDKEESAVARAAKSLGTTALTEIKKATSGVNNFLEAGLNGTATVAFEPGAGMYGQAPMTFTVNVQAGVGNPEEIGREVVKVIGEFERVNGTRWRG